MDLVQGGTNWTGPGPGPLPLPPILSRDRAGSVKKITDL